MPFVIVRPTPDLPRLHRQQRLRPIEGLNLWLLVDVEHRRVRGRIQRESDDISHRSTRSGSFDSLNVSLRCGCSPNVRQVRLIAM